MITLILILIANGVIVHAFSLSIILYKGIVISVRVVPKLGIEASIPKRILNKNAFIKIYFLLLIMEMIIILITSEI